METGFITIGILGLVIFSFLFYLIKLRNKHEGKEIRIGSVFAFWKEKGFIGFIGFYFYYLIVIGIIQLIFNIEFNGVFGYLIELFIAILPVIAISVLINRHRL
jgi:hypothetical protein